MSNKPFKIILKLILLNLLILSSFSAWSTHVIGGNISVIWESQNQYKIKVKIYRDDLSGGAQMPASIEVGIYEIGTNNLEGFMTIPLASTSIIPLGDECYTPDPNSLQIEEGVYESTSNFFINSFSPGYYVQTEIFARNTLALNLNVTPSNLQGMTFYCEIPDPALGTNSSPIFDDYPVDAYFCINSSKIFNFNVTDPDGDSLVYSLATPLGTISTTGGSNTTPGSGAYPYYPTVPWSAGYSLTNIVGGGSPMSINVITGDITAAPGVLGYFTFAVKVEEYRNGVKIGEVRSDIQYASLICSGSADPDFLNSEPTMGQTIQIPYNNLYCKDLIFNDINISDTLYIEMISPIFDSGAYQTTPIPDINGGLHFFYDFNGSIWTNSVVTSPNIYDNIVGAEFNIGTVANRFCWTPKCAQIGGTYPFKVIAFSLGCEGKSLDSIEFNIEVIPPIIEFGSMENISIPYGEEYCQDISFRDSEIVDVLQMNITSDIFNHGAYYPSVSNNYFYNDTLLTEVLNGGVNTNNLGSKFCWTPDCEHIGSVFNVQSILKSKECPAAIVDTISFDIIVTPPHDSLEVIPNVFTPNGDGMNDLYSISGISNPCNDNIHVKIFNRWGIKMYESTEPNFSWDGKTIGGGDVSSGTYFVTIQGVFGDELIELEKRTVTVLR
jgi:gliding motility-associated-like protein